MRKFHIAKGFEDKEINLPIRATKHAAGYDFEAAEDIVVPSVWDELAKHLVRYPQHVDLFVTKNQQKEDEAERLYIKEKNMTWTLANNPAILEHGEANWEFFKEMFGTLKSFDILPTMIGTGVKVEMEDDDVLYLFNRSSNPGKTGLVLANGVGVLDADYYNNPKNDGHAMFAFYNFKKEPTVIKKGERIGQGVFMKFLKTDDDIETGERTGGFGSTGK